MQQRARIERLRHAVDQCPADATERGTDEMAQDGGVPGWWSAAFGDAMRAGLARSFDAGRSARST